MADDTTMHEAQINDIDVHQRRLDRNETGEAFLLTVGA